VQDASTTAAYKLLVEPISERVRLYYNNRLIAVSDRAVMVHETQRPACCYLPPDDLRDAHLEPADHRTFCPFKGTAKHWNLVLPDKVIENAAWSYETPQDDIGALQGLVSFYPDPALRWESAAPFPFALEDDAPVGALARWLIREGWQYATPADLLARFGTRMVAEGIPLWRLNVNAWALHPELLGKRYTWYRDRPDVEISNMPHGLLDKPIYRNSPVRHVVDGLGGVRQRLDIDESEAEFHFPIMADLRAEGGTDYVAMPLPFSDGRIQALTLASDRPGGFSTADLGQIFECVFVLSRYLEVMIARENTATLLGTYLGPRTGARVMSGQTQRGAGETIRAAILFCDLRDSTELAQRLSRTDYLDALNRFFERVVGAVEDHNGEVLKFIGDAVLAIFPVDPGAGGEAGACRAALASARDIVASNPGGRPDSAVAVHIGELMYGNVGAANRLDFTVIGSAANLTARLSEHCKALDSPVLLSQATAKWAPEGLKSLGTHQLRDIGAPQEIFTFADL
jgi:adenylate cyclase